MSVNTHNWLFHQISRVKTVFLFQRLDLYPTQRIPLSRNSSFPLLFFSLTITATPFGVLALLNIVVPKYWNGDLNCLHCFGLTLFFLQRKGRSVAMM